MANVFKGTLDFTVKGANAIAKLNEEFDKLGVKIDLTYEKVRIGKKKVETASATLHGLNKQQINDIQEIIRVSNEYEKKVSGWDWKSGAKKMPSLMPGQYKTLKKDPTTGEFFDPDARAKEEKSQRDREQAEKDRTDKINRAREESNRKAKSKNSEFLLDLIQSTQKTLRQEDEATSKANIAQMKFRSTFQKDIDRSDFEKRRMAESDAFKVKTDYIIKGLGTELQVARRTKKLLADERKERVANLRIAKRHLYELEQMGREAGGMFQNFPVLKVFAFDMLRRTFSSMYQTVNAIGNEITGWFTESIKFNDEIRRSETFFTSLGLLGMKGAQGGQITLGEAKGSKDPMIQKALGQSTENSRKLMLDMMAISAETGQDLQEVVGSTRQATTDLLNKMVKDGKENPYLKTPEVFNDVSNRMVRLASVLRMSDPGNRKLSFHMVGLQELFSGTTEGKKDTGLANVLSLMRREGIKVGKAYATEISKLVNAGKLKEAMDVVEMVLTRSGLGIEQISNFMSETLQPAIDGTIMFLKVFGSIFTSEVYETLRMFFQEVVKKFSEMKKSESFVKMLERLGVLLDGTVTQVLFEIADIIDYINDNPIQFEKQISDALVIFRQGIQITTNLMRAFGLFMAGFLGGGESEGLQTFVDATEYIAQNARRAGENVRWFADKLIKYSPAIIGALIVGKIIGIVVSIMTFWGAIFGYLGGMLAAGSRWAAMGLRIARIFAALNLAGLLLTIGLFAWEFRDQIKAIMKNVFTLMKDVVKSGFNSIMEIFKSFDDKVTKMLPEFMQKGKKIHQDRIEAEKKKREERESASKNGGTGTKVSTSEGPAIATPVIPVKTSSNKGGPQIAINSLTVQANNPEQFKNEMAGIAVRNGVEPGYFTSIGALS
jgi:hypothetical protein